jgi:hypothetical protein
LPIVFIDQPHLRGSYLIVDGWFFKHSFAKKF